MRYQSYQEHALQSWHCVMYHTWSRRWTHNCDSVGGTSQPLPLCVHTKLHYPWYLPPPLWVALWWCWMRCTPPPSTPGCTVAVWTPLGRPVRTSPSAPTQEQPGEPSGGICGRTQGLCGFSGLHFNSMGCVWSESPSNYMFSFAYRLYKSKTKQNIICFVSLAPYSNCRYINYLI